MGIAFGQNWRYAIFQAIGGFGPYYFFRLSKRDQQELLDVAQRGINEHCAPRIRSLERCARDYAIAAIMLYGGLFVEEVVSLRRDAISSDKNNHHRISFVGTDGENYSQPLLSQTAAKAVTSYLLFANRRMDKKGSLFVSISRDPKALTPSYAFSQLSSLMHCAGIEADRITPYVLRNSFSKEFLDAGGDVEELRRILRIRSHKAMNHYLNQLKNPFIDPELDF